ncbi:hypothetical protein ZIOFF_026646 [Zingiber officinale]|uniref:ABC transporter family G domain-containing protein n=1 Tax=Zingiber officinale TaxID=94328 RepID=A0A8J5LI41_ZINOF|nr:hypothetical protein ZIOFF_026646 [Zingiber officinale]
MNGESARDSIRILTRIAKGGCIKACTAQNARYLFRFSHVDPDPFREHRQSLEGISGILTKRRQYKYPRLLVPFGCRVFPIASGRAGKGAHGVLEFDLLGHHLPDLRVDRLLRMVHQLLPPGLNFDFLVLNVTKHSSYLIYNAVLFFSPAVQRQYHEKYGSDEVARQRHQRRRASICVKLLTRSPLLFLDEPTSGLDSAVACHVVHRIARLTRRERMTVVVAVHQPDSEVFDLFDRLCLLAYGSTVFFGPAPVAAEFFASNGFACPSLRNPSNHFLRTINKDFDMVNVFILNLHGFQMIPVAANDVAFSIHAVALTAFTLFQVLIYDVSNPFLNDNMSFESEQYILAKTFLALAYLCIQRNTSYHDGNQVYPTGFRIHLHLKAMNCQLLVDIKKFSRSSLVAFMNFQRKSTVGWSIGNILLDLVGGLLNFAQMGTFFSADTLVNFYGNIGKTLLSVEVVLFDALFILQHYVFYPVKDENDPTTLEENATSSLLTQEKPEFKNV